MPTDDVTKKLAAINAGLSAALPTLGMVMQMARMVADLITAGPDKTKEFEERIARIHALASKLQSTSADWFQENPDFDPETGKRRAQ